MARMVLGALMLAGSTLATTTPAPEGAILPIGVQELPSALYGQQSSFSDQSKHAGVIGLALSTRKGLWRTPCLAETSRQFPQHTRIFNKA